MFFLKRPSCRLRHRYFIQTAFRMQQTPLFPSKLVKEHRRERGNSYENHILMLQQVLDELWIDQMHPEATVVLCWSSQSLSSTHCPQAISKQPQEIHSNKYAFMADFMLHSGSTLPFKCLLAPVNTFYRCIQTDTQTQIHKQVDSGTDLCDLCRGRHPWSQDGWAVICSPWWLKDEVDEVRGERERKEKEAAEVLVSRGAERSEKLRQTESETGCQMSCRLTFQYRRREVRERHRQRVGRGDRDRESERGKWGESMNACLLTNLNLLPLLLLFSSPSIFPSILLYAGNSHWGLSDESLSVKTC